MKVFITASSGIGKTAIIKELVRRDYTAYDADDRDLKLTRLEITATREPVEWPKGYVDFSKYSWNADETRFKELLASDDTVIMAGFLGNQEALYHYFDRLIALAILDPTEHERRLRTRPKREFGDDEKNIQRRLEKYSTHMKKFVESGFVIIDNSGSVQQTVDQIQQILST